MDAKYLGVTLSNDLEWSKHIATMTEKANSKLLFLHCNLWLPREALSNCLIFFYSLFYGVWHHCLGLILKVQQ